MKRYRHLFLLFILFISIVSCTPQKKLIYLQNAAQGSQVTVQNEKYTLRKGDVLSVRVFSVNEKVTQLFSATSSNVTSSTDIASYLNGFAISDSGDINLPLIGKLRIEGMTLQESAEFIEINIREFFFDAIVDIKLMSFQFTVLGEVNRPGTFRVYDPELNILEAIALAGDLNVYGKRELMLIRETSAGHEIHKIDLKDRNLMANEYFYLLPNDIIYVEPHKAKSFGFNTVPVNTLLTTISTLILILNFINK